ncbi:MAG: ferritin-like domain-containing protein [Acidimicrobiales bacterium]|nr:ferritin-like domain-containing protein [Acidimicrobiales bacterium]HRW37698.1 ferritin-like domain-containing protein [Aquihabitans sp.]
MPIDRSTQPTAGTTRRTFLARTAGIGALVTAGAVVAPTLGAAPWAGAQAGDSELTDAAFASFATPYELAAVQAYLLALRSGQLDATWTDRARQFQMNHQATADTLTTLLGDEDPAPRADADLVEQLTGSIGGAGSQEAVLGVLAGLEETLAATHLSAVPLLRDPITGRTVAQVVATESQQAALLGIDSGATFEELTPAEASDEGGIPLSDAPDAGDSTGETTTTAAN